MKRIILFIAILLLHISCWAQGNKNIIQLDIHAIDITASYACSPMPEYAIREPAGVYLKVHYEPFRESRIHEYLTELEPDTENKPGETGDFRAIMTVMYDDMTKSAYYMNRVYIANDGKVYKPHRKLIKAIYSLLPKSFWLENDNIFYDDDDKRYDEDE